MRGFELDDLVHVNEWLKLHGLPEMGYEDVPEIGLIEPRVAVGFLYQSDASFSWLDGFVANPNASVVKRARAIKEIVAELTELSEGLGFRKVYGFTSKPTMQRVCIQNGFSLMGTFRCMGKEL